MQSVPIHRLKTELSRFIQVAEAGEEISITRRGAEVARLVPSVRAVKPNRAESIRAARVVFAQLGAFDERELTAEGRQW